MKKIKTFAIKGKELYLEKTLVDFNGIPVFFVCRDEDDSLFLALCYDLDLISYYVIPVKATTIIDMLKKRISMRDSFFKSQIFYEIKTANSFEQDSVSEKSISEIDESNLPVENAFLELETDNLKLYAKEFSDNLRYEKSKFLDSLLQNLGEYQVKTNVLVDGPSNLYEQNGKAANKFEIAA